MADRIPDDFASREAARRGLPVVICTTHELFNVLAGNALVMGTVDGAEVLVRLATPDEFVEVNHRGIANLPEGCRPEPVSRERAADLVQPIDVLAALRGG